MQFVVDSFEFLINTINSIWDFFTGLLENLLLMFGYIGQAAEMGYSLIATLPAWLQAFATCTILISVLYLIVGRETGGK